MTSPFYSYEQRENILPISWNDCFALCKGLALAVEPYRPEIILGIIRGGLYPATMLSHLLQAELYTIRLTRRFADRVVYDEPHWIVRPPEIVAGRRVLIVDEICSEGLTIRMAREETLRAGAAEARGAVLYAHTWGQDIPDYIGLISDALILNPWDREIVRDGAFQVHPEYIHALEQQGRAPSPDFLLGVEPIMPAKRI